MKKKSQTLNKVENTLIEKPINNELVSDLHLNEEFQYKQAKKLYLKKEKIESKRILEEILLKNPINKDALFFLSSIYIKEKVYEDLKRITDNAIIMAPESPDILLFQAIVYKELGMPIGGIMDTLERNINNNPKNWKAYYSYAVLLNEQRQYKKAYQNYKKAFIIKPSYNTFSGLFFFIFLRMRLLVAKSASNRTAIPEQIAQ